MLGFSSLVLGLIKQINMKIVRIFNFYAYFLPLVIKINDKNVNKLTAVNSTAEFKEINNGDLIEVSLGRMKSIIKYKGGHLIMLDQPNIIKTSFISSFISLIFLLIVKPESEFITYLFLIPPVIFLITILYYYILNPNSFIKVTEI
jgi:hypothetical protein